MISVEDNDDVEAKKESIGANIQKKEDFKKVLHDEEPKAQDEKIKDGDAKNLNVIFEEGNDDEKKRYNEFQNKNNKDNMIEGEKLNDKINILFEKILNKINMGNDVKINLEEIKSNINIIIDENQKMKEKVFIMENKMEQMNQQIQELSK